MGNTQHSKTGYFLFYYMKFPSLIYIIAYFSYNSNSFLKETSVLLNWLQFVHHISHFSHIIRMCKTIITHLPCFAKSLKIAIISVSVSLSKLPVGSSAIIPFASYAILLAIATLCSSPSESFNTRLHLFLHLNQHSLKAQSSRLSYLYP